MYFELPPKYERKNLYNREKELEELHKALEHNRIILIQGLRRIGKTSLIQVFLNEQKNPFIFLDARKYVYDNRFFDKASFNKELINKTKEIIKKYGLRKILSRVSKVSIGGTEIQLTNSTKKEASFVDILTTLNAKFKETDKKLIIAIDEAQNLRFYGKGGYDILNLLAHSYDNLLNVVFILTGSEVGLLHDFLKVEDPNQPLFGRYMHEITLERFEREESINFLLEGFKQIGIEPDIKEIENAVNELDGIVGYLAIYGFTVYESGEWQNALEKTKNQAVRLVKNELQNLANRSSNYLKVLEAIAFGMDKFSKIKKYITANFSAINDQTLTNILSGLVKSGFVEIKYIKATKQYYIPDPIVKSASLQLKT
ncbi:AAA family ATPase [Kosmotoga pacifica]|uniref:Uncharacterized protein n=1 Tax=Kosmotoga pacifica TaxID=1330330 RepID=A0A0G2Z4W6_9BACT|nr:ATP-binding protein [Kosmotoga pacifica]AKI96655.1 hypothetical protein IX53_01160 [Kosmotoga pacifica]